MAAKGKKYETKQAKATKKHPVRAKADKEKRRKAAHDRVWSILSKKRKEDKKKKKKKTISGTAYSRDADATLKRIKGE